MKKNLAGKAIKKLWDQAQGQIAVIRFSFFKKLDFFFSEVTYFTLGMYEVINFICNFIVNFVI